MWAREVHFYFGIGNKCFNQILFWNGTISKSKFWSNDRLEGVPIRPGMNRFTATKKNKTSNIGKSPTKPHSSFPALPCYFFFLSNPCSRVNISDRKVVCVIGSRIVELRDRKQICMQSRRSKYNAEGKKK